jgi:hypothetical protein
VFVISLPSALKKASLKFQDLIVFD